MEDGLPSNQVYKVIQDDIGYLWFLTDKGVSRYDGYEFENFTTANGLTDNIFFQAQKTQDGKLWLMGMNRTVTLVDPKRLKFDAYEYNDTLLKYTNQSLIPLRFTIDHGELTLTYCHNTEYLRVSDRGMVVATNRRKEYKKYYSYLTKSQLYYFSSEKVNREDSRVNGILRKPMDYSYAFVLNENGTSIQIHSKDSILVGSAEPFTLFQKNILKTGPIDDSTFWVSSRYGGVKFYSIEGELKGGFMPKESVVDIFRDNRGELWFSTLYSGAFQQRKINACEFTFQNAEDKNVYQLVAGRENQLYVGSNNGNVAKIVNGREESIYRSTVRTPACVSLFDNDVYFYTDFHLFNYESGVLKRKLLPFGATNRIEKFGVDFTLCTAIGFFQYNGEKFTERFHKDLRIYDLMEINGISYYATPEGVMCETKVGDSMSSFFYKAYQKRVDALCKLGKFIALGTHGDGLVIVDGDSIIQRVNGRSIGSDYVNELLVENDSTIWACTSSGLSRLVFNDDCTKYRSRVLREMDGVRSPEVTGVALSGNEVWIGTKTGLFTIPKAYFQSSGKKVDYQLTLERILVNNKVRAIDGPVELTHLENELTIDYTAILFGGYSQELVYRYRMIGVNEDWIYTRNRSVTYSSLAPGSYDFIVQIRGENDTWSEETKTLRITVLPPFWKTWWFNSIMVVVVILLIYSFFRFKILLYNKDLVRELLRHSLKRIRKTKPYVIVKEGSSDVKIFCHEIKYVKSDGNYIEIHHDSGKTVVRSKISSFLNLVPDPIEYVQVRRSYIVRIDKVEQKSKKEIVVDGQKIKVGSTYLEELDKISL